MTTLHKPVRILVAAATSLGLSGAVQAQSLTSALEAAYKSKKKEKK